MKKTNCPCHNCTNRTEGIDPSVLDEMIVDYVHEFQCKKKEVTYSYFKKMLEICKINSNVLVDSFNNTKEKIKKLGNSRVLLSSYIWLYVNGNEIYDSLVNNEENMDILKSIQKKTKNNENFLKLTRERIMLPPERFRNLLIENKKSFYIHLIAYIIYIYFQKIFNLSCNMECVLESKESDFYVFKIVLPEYIIALRNTIYGTILNKTKNMTNQESKDEALLYFCENELQQILEENQNNILSYSGIKKPNIYENIKSSFKMIISELISGIKKILQKILKIHNDENLLKKDSALSYFYDIKTIFIPIKIIDNKIINNKIFHIDTDSENASNKKKMDEKIRKYLLRKYSKNRKGIRKTIQSPRKHYTHTRVETKEHDYHKENEEPKKSDTHEEKRDDEDEDEVEDEVEDDIDEETVNNIIQNMENESEILNNKLDTITPTRTVVKNKRYPKVLKKLRIFTGDNNGKIIKYVTPWNLCSKEDKPLPGKTSSNKNCQQMYQDSIEEIPPQYKNDFSHKRDFYTSKIPVSLEFHKNCIDDKCWDMDHCVKLRYMAEHAQKSNDEDFELSDNTKMSVDDFCDTAMNNEVAYGPSLVSSKRKGFTKKGLDNLYDNLVDLKKNIEIIQDTKNTEELDDYFGSHDNVLKLLDYYTKFISELEQNFNVIDDKAINKLIVEQIKPLLKKK